VLFLLTVAPQVDVATKQHMPKPDAQVPEELPPAVVHSEEVRQVPKIPDD